MCRDHPPDRGRRGGPSSRCDRHAVGDPRPAGHGLVAGRAAIRLASLARPVQGGRPPGRRRLDVERRRARPTRGAGRDRGNDRDRGERLRHGPPVSLARGDRVDLRRPGLPAVPPLAAAHRGHVRDTRRVRRPWLDQPRQARVPRRVAGVAPRVQRRQAAGACHRRRSRAGVEGAVWVGHTPGRESRDGGDAVRRPRRGGHRDPSGRLADAVWDHPAYRAAVRSAGVRAAGGRHGRSRDRPRPGVAGRRRVPGAALPRRPARRRRSPRRSDRSGPPRPRLGRDLADGSQAGRRRIRKGRARRERDPRSSSFRMLRRPRAGRPR